MYLSKWFTQKIAKTKFILSSFLKKKANSNEFALYFFIGGADEDRTRYLLHAMEALSQVSYSPNKSAYYSGVNYILKSEKCQLVFHAISENLI